MIRTQAIIEIRKSNPCATLKQIGDKIGVTRERVRQILNENRLPTIHWKQKYLCIVCGSEIKERNRKWKHSAFCSVECGKKYHHPTLICDQCGKAFTRQLSYILRTKNDAGTFCSRQCYGKWLGRNYGFSVHPENCGAKSKYDYSEIDRLYIEGLSCAEISRRLNMPVTTIYSHYYRYKEVSHELRLHSIRQAGK